MALVGEGKAPIIPEGAQGSTAEAMSNYQDTQDKASIKRQLERARAAAEAVKGFPGQVGYQEALQKVKDLEAKLAKYG